MTENSKGQRREKGNKQLSIICSLLGDYHNESEGGGQTSMGSGDMVKIKKNVKQKERKNKNEWTRGRKWEEGMCIISFFGSEKRTELATLR